MNAHVGLMAALIVLSALFGAWFGGHADMAALLVFQVPPLLLAVLTWRRPRAGAFWSGVFALAWFSHGVMAAWSRPGERGYALAEIALALLVVFAANFDALRARLGRRRGGPNV